MIFPFSGKIHHTFKEWSITVRVQFEKYDCTEKNIIK